MGREIKRVPLDFAWPLSMPWKGYVSPYCAQECKACDSSGYNPETKKISDDWYDLGGNDTRWCHNITQDEVKALIEAGRLYDFTHRWTKDNGWQKIDPQPEVTAVAINAWSRGHFGHDAINRGICVETRARRLEVYGLCYLCKGEGDIWFSDEIRELSENWEGYDPPAGDGWQVWETVSDGSPISPVFVSSDELTIWLRSKGYSDTAIERFIEAGWTMSAMAYVAPDGTGKFARNIESLALETRVGE